MTPEKIIEGMGLKPITFVVMRRGVVNESTVAIVHADVVPELHDEVKFRDALREVFTWWMLNTQAGETAVKNSGYDFNIGDVVCFVNTNDPIVATKLLAAGIANLAIHIASSDTAGEWTYDDHLFDDTKVTPK